MINNLVKYHSRKEIHNILNSHYYFNIDNYLVSESVSLIMMKIRKKSRRRLHNRC